MTQILSDNMVQVLMQIGFGVTARRGGFFDGDAQRVNLNTVNALIRRSLVTWGTTGGAPNRLTLELTDAGQVIFNEYLS